jgi:serine/threonine protein kinase
MCFSSCFYLQVVLNLSVYLIEVVLITSPNIVTKMCPNIPKSDSGVGSCAFLFLDGMFAASFGTLCLYYLGLGMMIVPHHALRAWQDRHVATRGVLFRESSVLYWQMLVWSLLRFDVFFFFFFSRHHAHLSLYPFYHQHSGACFTFRCVENIFDILNPSSSSDCFDKCTDDLVIFKHTLPYYLIGEWLPIAFAVTCKFVNSISCRSSGSELAPLSQRLLPSATTTGTDTSATAVCCYQRSPCACCQCCVVSMARCSYAHPSCLDADGDPYCVQPPPTDENAQGSAARGDFSAWSCMCTLAPLAAFFGVAPPKQSSSSPLVTNVCGCCEWYDEEAGILSPQQSPVGSPVPNTAKSGQSRRATSQPAISPAPFIPALPPSFRSGFSPARAYSTASLDALDTLEVPPVFSDAQRSGIKQSASDEFSEEEEEEDAEVDHRLRRGAGSSRADQAEASDSLICGYDPGARKSGSVTANIRQYEPSDIVVGTRMGVGNFGEVYHAVLNRTTDVAVKRLFIPQQRQTPETYAAFMEEVQLLGRLQHPNVIQFLGIVRPPELAMVTEFMDLGSLHDVLYSANASSLTWPLVVSLLRDAARGLDYLHKIKPPVIHRDVKPANLLVNHNFQIKVADFGISRVESLTQTMTAIGTAQWMAPEIIRNAPYSTSADVYSFGVVIWEVCTRQVPFGSCNPMQVVFKVNAGERPPITDGIPRVLADLIERCWHEDQYQRPAFVDVVQILNTAIPDATWPPYPKHGEAGGKNAVKPYVLIFFLLLVLLLVLLLLLLLLEANFAPEFPSGPERCFCFIFFLSSSFSISSNSPARSPFLFHVAITSFNS